MKQILLLGCLLRILDASAQVNYHFCEPPGAYVRTTFPTFDGNPGNWQRSHGSPSLGNSLIYMWSNLDESGNIVGEGIYQDNVLPTRGYYKIKIGIIQAPGATTGKINVFAAKGLTPYTGLASGTAIPSPASQTLIGTWTSGAVPSGTTHWDVNTAFFNPYDNAQLWIYPEHLPGAFGGPDAIFRIDYATACRIDPEPGVTYNSGIMPYGFPLDKVFYRVGSSFPGGSGIVNNNKTKDTRQIATTYIDMAPNTYLEVSNKPESISGYFYEAMIVPPGSCDYNLDIICPPVPSSRMAGSEQETAAAIAIEVFPNPNNGLFTVRLPEEGPYDITVATALGQVIYQSRAKEAGNLQVQLPEAAPGSYWIRVSNGQTQSVRHMTLIR